MYEQQIPERPNFRLSDIVRLLTGPEIVPALATGANINDIQPRIYRSVSMKTYGNVDNCGDQCPCQDYCGCECVELACEEDG